MADQILKRLIELQTGQDQLRQEFSQGQQELLQGQDQLRREVLGAIGESNESVMSAVQALYGAFHDLRGRVEDLERKAG